MRLARVAVGVVALLLGLVIGGPAGASEDTVTRNVSLPFAPTVGGADGVATVSVPVPPGSLAVALTGVIASTYTAAGTIAVVVSGRQVASVPAVGGGRIAAELRPDDLTDGAVAVSLVARLDPSADCLAGYGETATLRDGRVLVEAPTAIPTSLGEFLTAGPTAWSVAVAPDVTDSEREAALNAVAALVHRFGTGTEVRLVPGTEPVGDSALERRVVVEESAATGSDVPGGVLELTPGGALLITGDQQTLNAAAWALADPALSLVSAARLAGVSATPDWRPAVGRTPLSDLGIGLIDLRVIGRQDVVIPINQAAFGGPISSLEIDLLTTLTPLPPGATGAVAVSWNGEPRGSVPMSARTELPLSLTIEAADLQRSNELGLSVTFFPAGRDCRSTPLPARVQIDPRTSTVVPTYGDSVLPGFERFPQVLGPTVPLALGAAAPPAELIVQAGDLVAGLAALTPQQLAVDLVNVDDMPGQAASGLVVGASDGQLAVLGSPFTENQILLARDPLALADAADPEPLAVGVAYQVGNRDLAVFLPEPNSGGGPASQAAAALASRLAIDVATEPERWGILRDQVTVLDDTGDLTVVSMPNRQVNRQLGPSPNVLVGVGALVTVALIVIVVVWSLRRPREPAPDLPGGEDP